MTTTPLGIRGQTITLADGAQVTQWVEHGDDGCSVTILDADGQQVGRVTATRRPGHAPAELSLWTGRPWRNHGLATMALETTIDWARTHAVPYLVGDVTDPESEPFLHRPGRIVAIRGDERGRRFAMLVPAA